MVIEPISGRLIETLDRRQGDSAAVDLREHGEDNVQEEVESSEAQVAQSRSVGSNVLQNFIGS